MSQSQVVSFRASGDFLNWIEAQRLDGESVSQAAQRILKELSGTSTALSTMSTTGDTNEDLKSQVVGTG
jgi:ADP-ribose pyrophosphatase YjhB (NUDIX family)